MEALSQRASGLAARYRTLEADRQPYLDRAREAARVTIPALMPPQGSTGSTKLRAGHQSFGARAVNNLASKMVLALQPPNRPFHRTDIDELSMAKLTQQPGQKAELQDGLAKYDRSLNTHVEASQLRTKANEGFKQLLVAGNVLMHIMDERQVRIHRLDSYVVERDATGTVLSLIIHEQVSPRTLDEATREACQVQTKSGPTGKEKDVSIYTGVDLQFNGKYRVWQEVNDFDVPDSAGTFTAEALPFLALRFYAVDGESYGRGYVEEYMGDLISMEGHAKSINEGAILANKYIFFVRPGGTVNLKQLEKARNGAVLRGDANDISTMRIDKSNDMRVGMEVLNGIESRLSYAFLLHSAIQRSGERVTAEEIRLMAQELEDGLGGIYSLMSQEYQLPLVRVYRALLERKGKLPALPKDVVSVKIVTGLEALGRGQDTESLRTFLADVQQIGPEAFAMLDMREVMVRLAVSRGIDTTDLVKTTEQLAQEQQAAQMAQLAQQAAPGVIQEGATRMMDAGMGGQMLEAAAGMVPEA